MASTSACGQTSKDNTRRDNWDDEEVKILITLWGDDTIQRELEGCGRNINIYRRLSARLTRGFVGGRTTRNAVACRSKIKSLTHAYRKCRDNNNRSGRAPQTFRYYDLLDAILGTRPTAVPLRYVDTDLMSVDGDTEADPEELVVGAEEEIGHDVLVDVEVEVEVDLQSEVGTPSETASVLPTPPRTQATQPTVRARKGKALGKNDRVMQSLITQFIGAQKDAATVYQEHEERRMERDMEMEERRTKHELDIEERRQERLQQMEERWEERQQQMEERREQRDRELEERRQERAIANQAQHRKHEENMMHMMMSMQRPSAPQQFQTATTDGLTRITLLTPNIKPPLPALIQVSTNFSNVSICLVSN